MRQSLPVVLPGQQHDAMRPGKAEEHAQECRGIEHTLIPQNGAGERNAHKAAVAVDGGKTLDLRLTPRLRTDQQIHRRNEYPIRRRSQQERPQHIHHQPGLILHIGIGVHHQHRRHDLQHEVGELPAAVFIDDLCPIGDDAHHIQQQHQYRLF